MEEKDYSLLTAQELADILKAKELPENELDAAEGELIKRIKSGECDVSILDGIDLPSGEESVAAEENLSGNRLILPGAYAFPSLAGLIIMLLAFAQGAMTVYALVKGSYLTDVMSFLYYFITVVLVEFGKFFVAGLVIRLLADIAYNTFRKKK